MDKMEALWMDDGTSLFKNLQHRVVAVTLFLCNNTLSLVLTRWCNSVIRLPLTVLMSVICEAGFAEKKNDGQR